MSATINTNIASYFAQQNLKAASTKTRDSIARLSSGNRIIKASDDVAALSIGTILKSNVSTLKTALTNTQQANSLLQVADGGLKNIGDILQRQKSLAVQANSGTLSDSERAYLDQEFQSLKNEIDRLVQSTKFNAVSLLDGSLSKAVAITSNTTTIANTSIGAAGSNLTFNAAPTNGNYIEVNGARVYFTNATVGSADAKGKIRIGADVTETALNTAAFLNTASDGRINAARFTSAGGVVTAAGALGAQNANITFSFAAGTANVTANNTNGLNATNMLDGLARYRTYASGDVSGNILYSLNAVSNTNVGINVLNVTDNAAFIGKLNNFTVTYTGSGSNIVVSSQIGNITYTSGVVDFNNSTQTANIVLNGSNGTGAQGGNFTLSMQLSNNTVDSQGEANTLANALNDALSSVTFTQTRDVKSYSPGGFAYNNGVKVATLVRSTVDFKSDDFTNFNIEGIKVTAPGFGSTDIIVEATINGEIYRSYAGIGSQLAQNSLLILGNVNDSGKSLTISLGNDTVTGTTAVNIASQADADAFASALEEAFGIDSGKSKVVFQTGVSSTDQIGIEIKNANTNSLYGGLALSIDTAVNAVAAGSQLDVAITVVTALRADVGALQSRFNYAGANLDTAIQNQDAARATFLDADISAESTNYATEQVKLQASVSVLAQANQLSQNLLKLIG